MSDQGPTVALVHASPASMAPAKEAFAELFPNARLWHLLDDRLVTDADAAGGLTPPLYGRMASLIAYAVENGADAVQLSCSMYGPVAQGSDHPVPVLASDQAMFDAVADSGAGRALVLGSLSSAAEDSAQRLRDHLSERNVDVQVVAMVAVGAAAAASAGDHTELGRLLANAALSRCKKEDVVVLAQYSLAPARDAISAAVQVPVLSPPHLAATTLRDRLLRRAT